MFLPTLQVQEEGRWKSTSLFVPQRLPMPKNEEILEGFGWCCLSQPFCGFMTLLRLWKYKNGSQVSVLCISLCISISIFRKTVSNHFLLYTGGVSKLFRLQVTSKHWNHSGYHTKLHSATLYSVLAVLHSSGETRRGARLCMASQQGCRAIGNQGKKPADCSDSYMGGSRRQSWHAGQTV